MSTNTAIIAKTKPGYSGIYLHWDGYPEHALKILRKHYTDPKKVAQLIALGNLSSIAPEIGEKHDFDWDNKLDIYASRKDPRNKMCRAYGRDRGEKWHKALNGKDATKLAERILGFGGYIYIFDGKKWIQPKTGK